MKQGRASSNRVTGYKREPNPHAISIGGVSQLGNQTGTHSTDRGETGYTGEQMRDGRGYSAPNNVGRTIYQGGSQRRYK